eukprot:941429-Amphidinium_carterae.1
MLPLPEGWVKQEIHADFHAFHAVPDLKSAMEKLLMAWSLYLRQLLTTICLLEMGSLAKFLAGLQTFLPIFWAKVATRQELLACVKTIRLACDL